MLALTKYSSNEIENKYEKTNYYFWVIKAIEKYNN